MSSKSHIFFFISNPPCCAIFQEVLGKRERHEDVFMFWSLLNRTTADGLVDIVKLCQDGQGVKVGTMTDVVERPGYDLGSAFCVHGKLFSYK